mmetsp:Transcript_124903/g.347769  ORF Transcript_124903/g.347769 Transcript_124903/m.347769 type:complete len:213 (-) Transcript_124903:404-1042(-)
MSMRRASKSSDPEQRSDNDSPIQSVRSTFGFPTKPAVSLTAAIEPQGRKSLVFRRVLTKPKEKREVFANSGTSWRGANGCPPFIIFKTASKTSPMVSALPVMRSCTNVCSSTSCFASSPPVSSPLGLSAAALAPVASFVDCGSSNNVFTSSALFMHPTHPGLKLSDTKACHGTKVETLPHLPLFRLSSKPLLNTCRGACWPSFLLISGSGAP